MKRKRSEKLTTADQLRVAGSPATFEIVEALQTAGPATVRELGPRLGRRPNSLHYHIRKLKEAGLIHEVGSRRSGARSEAIYDVIADVFRGKTVPRERPLREATIAAVHTLLRRAAREFERASDRVPPPVETGKQRTILAQRFKGWLTRDELAAVNEHLVSIDRIFTEAQGRSRGKLCALTVAMSPLEPDSSR